MITFADLIEERALTTHRPKEVVLKEVVLDETVRPLDPTFFIAFRRRGEVDVEAKR